MTCNNSEFYLPPSGQRIVFRLDSRAWCHKFKFRVKVPVPKFRLRILVWKATVGSWRVEHQRTGHSVALSQYAGVPSPNRKTKQMVDQGCILRKTVYRNETSCRTDRCLPFGVKIRAWRLWMMDTECQATGAGGSAHSRRRQVISILGTRRSSTSVDVPHL